MQLIESADGEMKKSELLNALSCYGFTKMENACLIRRMIDLGLMESLEGDRWDGIQKVYSTRKLRLYANKLSRSLIYLENVRNDAYIEYAETPHEVRDPLYVDGVGVMRFIEYIVEQEKEEYKWMKSTRRCMTKYRRLAQNGGPVSWVLLCAVSREIRGLTRGKFAGQSQLLSDSERKQLRIAAERLARAIKKACDDNMVHPSALGERLVKI